MATYAEDHLSLLRMHQVPAHTPVRQLLVAQAFAKLTTQEAHYAHHFMLAAWAGAKTCLEHVSHESPAIFDCLLALFSFPSAKESYEAFCDDMVKWKNASGVSEDAWKGFVAYCACFFANMGNYLSFGDSKMIPSLTAEEMETIMHHCHSPKAHAAAAKWEELQEVVFSVNQSDRELGWHPNGTSGYYSPGFTKEEAERVGRWMSLKGLEPWNTRVWRLGESEEGLPRYAVRVAAAHVRKTEEESFEGALLHITYGDYSLHMAAVAEHLTKAAHYAANDTQRHMVEAYIKHFQSGDIEMHKESQRLWVKDKGPTVETNIGFIETYRDPLGVRAEFEGLVAVVNKEQSAKFGDLVDAAPELLAKMPWSKEFEKDVFSRPDFTSLEVAAFASTGIPVGINIPNYQDIRGNLGFKNVSLGNVLSATESKEPITFIAVEEQELYRTYKARSFEVQVGCHELLGHGSGKMLTENADGTKNFDPALINPLTGQPVESWYKPGETWDALFGHLSGPMEECRAELTGLFMSTDPRVLEIFHEAGPDAGDVTYINWLLMVRAGICSLEYYSAETEAWRQAHMQARYAILKTLLAAAAADQSGGKPFLEIKHIRGPDGQLTDLEASLNREKILSVGVPAVKKLLHDLNIHKATANVADGTAMFKTLTSVQGEWLELRKVVLNRKQPRPIFAQASSVLDHTSPNGVRIVEFNGSHEGLIQSFVFRYT